MAEGLYKDNLVIKTPNLTIQAQKEKSSVLIIVKSKPAVYIDIPD